MVEYPTDLDLNGDKDVHLDGSNDLATTSGIEQLQQSVAIDVFDETRHFVGSGATGKALGLLEESIRESINDDPQISDIRTVDIAEYNREAGTVFIDIVTAKDDEFTIGVST